MSPPGPPDMVICESIVKLFLKSPSPARVIFASMPLLGQSPTTLKPPVAVRSAVIEAHLPGSPSVGSIGLPSKHLALVCAAPPSWLETRVHSPAVGAGSALSWIGPAAAPATVAAAFAAAPAADAAADAVAAAAFAAPSAAFAVALTAGLLHAASAAAAITRRAAPPLQPRRIASLPAFFVSPA